MFVKALAMALVGTAAVSAVATPTAAPTPAFSGAWESLFQPPYRSAPSIMMALSCVDKDNCFVPGGENGAGFDIFRFDGKPNGAFVGDLMPSKPAMIMGIGMGGTAAAPKGAAGGMGLGNGVQYCKNTTTFLKSTTHEFIVVSQDVRATKDGQNIIVMDGTGNAVLHSTDAGVDFSPKKITSTLPGNPGCAAIRYGAIASADTFYVTLGSWPENNNKDSEHPLSRRSKLVRKADGSVKREVFTPEAIVGGNQTCGYTAAIAKTTDGGSSWTTAYASADNFYFNAIDCSTATHCIAVGEGFDANAGTHVYMTTDGAKFEQVLFMPSTKAGKYSFMAIEFVDELEAWIGGSKVVNQFDSTAIFLRTVDGGKTWVEYPHGLPNMMEVTSLSFVGDKTGFATAMTSSDDSTILRFEHGAKPTKYFTQMQCQAAGCKSLCQNASFALDACLPLGGGGSAKATCGKTALQQEIFKTSNNCVGDSVVQVVDLNKCEKDTQGTYFEVFCDAATGAKMDASLRTQ